MRISDWRSDVCSSDLPIFRKEFERAIVLPPGPPLRAARRRRRMVAHHIFTPALALAASALAFSTPASAQLLGGSGGLGGGLGGSLRGTLGTTLGNPPAPNGGTLGSADRKGVVSGKRVSVRGDLGVRPRIQKK